MGCARPGKRSDTYPCRARRTRLNKLYPAAKSAQRRPYTARSHWPRWHHTVFNRFYPLATSPCHGTNAVQGTPAASLDRKLFMTTPHPRTTPLHRLLLAGLLASASLGATAQPATSAASATQAATESQPAAKPGGRHDRAARQAWLAKRQAELKAKLGITPAQESAWASYTAAVQPPAHRPTRMTPAQYAEISNLPTPERIDRMRALRTQHMADMTALMDARADATKALYAALSPAQQQNFDAHCRTSWPAKRGHHRHHGSH